MVGFFSFFVNECFFLLLLFSLFQSLFIDVYLEKEDPKFENCFQEQFFVL